MEIEIESDRFGMQSDGELGGPSLSGRVERWDLAFLNWASLAPLSVGTSPS